MSVAAEGKPNLIPLLDMVLQLLMFFIICVNFVTEQMNADIYIPGHGFTESAAVSREELRTYHAALQAVIAEATRLYKAGVPVENAVKQANFGEYSSWTLAAGQAPIAMRKVYEELSGQLK